MLIISSVVIVSAGNVISKATKARFYEDMNQLESKKEVTKLKVFFDSNGSLESENSFFSRNLTTEEIAELDETLKAEIIYVRNAFGKKEVFTTKQVWKNNMFECKEMYTVAEYLEGLS